MRSGRLRGLAGPLVAISVGVVWIGSLSLRANAGGQDAQNPAQTPAPAPQAANAVTRRPLQTGLRDLQAALHRVPRRREGKRPRPAHRGRPSEGRPSAARSSSPHKPAESRLYKAVMHDGDLEMPDGKEQLPESDRDTIKRWIEAGASLAAVAEATADPNPDAALLARREERPITPEERRVLGVQAADASRRARGHARRLDVESDRRVRAVGDGSKGLKPAPAADKRALVRRAVSRRDRPAADARRDRRVRQGHRRPTRGRAWSTRSSPRRTTASAGRATGWTSSATRTPAASSSTWTGPRCTATATTSSTRSTKISRTTSS